MNLKIRVAIQMKQIFPLIEKCKHSRQSGVATILQIEQTQFTLSLLSSFVLTGPFKVFIMAKCLKNTPHDNPIQLPEGWKRKVTERMNGKSAGKLDVIVTR